MFGYLKGILLALLALKVSQSDLFISGVKFILTNSYSVISSRLPSSLLSNISYAFSLVPCQAGYFIEVSNISWLVQLLIGAFIFRMIIRQLPFGGK